MLKKLWDRLVGFFKRKPAVDATVDDRMKDVMDAVQELNKDTSDRKAVQISSDGQDGVDKIKFLLKKRGWSDTEIETVVGELWPKWPEKGVQE